MTSHKRNHSSSSRNEDDGPFFPCFLLRTPTLSLSSALSVGGGIHHWRHFFDSDRACARGGPTESLHGKSCLMRTALLRGMPRRFTLMGPRAERRGCQMAKFDPFLSLDCAGVEGVGAWIAPAPPHPPPRRNPRKGRDHILQCIIAEP